MPTLVRKHTQEKGLRTATYVGRLLTLTTALPNYSVIHYYIFILHVPSIFSSNGGNFYSLYNGVRKPLIRNMAVLSMAAAILLILFWTINTLLWVIKFTFGFVFYPILEYYFDGHVPKVLAINIRMAIFSAISWVVIGVLGIVSLYYMYPILFVCQ